MTTDLANDASYTVRLSVDGHDYSAELWRGGDANWILLSVQIDGAQAKHLNWQTSSCLGALSAAEALVSQLIEVIKNGDEKPADPQS